jgi:transposase-like protein
MTDNIMTLIDYLRKIGMQADLDFYREAAQYFGQKIIDLEAEEVIGAKKHERTDSQTNHRNGTQDRKLDTRVGELDLKIPKLRKGSFFPSILERQLTDLLSLHLVGCCCVEGQREPTGSEPILSHSYWCRSARRTTYPGF